MRSGSLWNGCLGYMNNLNRILMDWLHIIAVVALIVIGVVIYIKKRQD